MTLRVDLPDDISAPRIARRSVREHFASSPDAWSDEFVDDAELITSELVANAVRHGKPPFDLTIDVAADGVRISVANGGAHGEPRVENAGHDAGRGRGLAMVSTLADDWGWDRDGDRITVWAYVTAR